MGSTGFPLYKNINVDTKIMSLCALELNIWHFFHFWGGHFENPRWPPPRMDFGDNYWILHSWKYGYRHQNNVSMCIRTQNMAFFHYWGGHFENPRWPPPRMDFGHYYWIPHPWKYGYRHQDHVSTWPRNQFRRSNRWFGGHFEKSWIKRSPRRGQSVLTQNIDKYTQTTKNLQKNKVFRALRRWSWKSPSVASTIKASWGIFGKGKNNDSSDL